MLKTHIGNEVWLVHQPDHARLAGYLAAHWEAPMNLRGRVLSERVTHADAIRDEVILAIAEHDNGWWEWEAIPSIDADDGFHLD